MSMSGQINTRYGANDRYGSFEQWMAAVDRFVEAKVGCSAQDLPDAPYMDWYERNVGPRGAAGRAIREAGFNFVVHEKCARTPPEPRQHCSFCGKFSAVRTMAYINGKPFCPACIEE